MMLDFFRLARLNAGGEEGTWANGFLLPFKTIASLLLISATITATWWLWSGVLAAATFGWVAASVAVAALLNHWFARDFFTASFATREVSHEFDFGEKNSTDLGKLVDHARAELNVYFKEKYGDAHEDIPTIGIFTYTKSECEIFSFGCSPDNAGIFISSGVFDYKKTMMNQKHVLTLIQMELIKLYLMRHRSSLLMSIGINLLTTLEMLGDKSAWQGAFRVIPWVFGVLSGFQFFMLFQYALERTFAYEAARIIVELGRGAQLVEAYDKKVCPHLINKPTKQGLRNFQEQYRREPYTYNGPFRNWLGPYLESIAAFIDKHEYARNYKGGSRWRSLLGIGVREIKFFFDELFSKYPRSTNLCGDIRPRIKAMINEREVTLDNALTDAEIFQIKQTNEAINEQYWRKMPENMDYEPVSPYMNGIQPRRFEKDAYGHKMLHTEMIFRSRRELLPPLRAVVSTPSLRDESPGSEPPLRPVLSMSNLRDSTDRIRVRNELEERRREKNTTPEHQIKQRCRLSAS